MGHWYDKEGKPQHFTNGRASTLRDARKHNWYPSVTGILDTIDKPGLNRWKEQQVLLAALTLPKIENEPLDQFSKRVMADAFVESSEARDKGSEIHDSIESVWLGAEPEKHAGIAHKTVNAVIEYCDTDDFIPEKTVVGDGYGGKIDLHNDDFVIDYKGKDITDKQWDDYQNKKNPRLAYPEMCMQLSAYDRALGGFKIRKLINVFVDRNIAGKVIIHKWAHEDTVIAYKKFELLVKYWQLTKNYSPNIVSVNNNYE